MRMNFLRTLYLIYMVYTFLYTYNQCNVQDYVEGTGKGKKKKKKKV